MHLEHVGRTASKSPNDWKMALMLPRPLKKAPRRVAGWRAPASRGFDKQAGTMLPTLLLLGTPGLLSESQSTQEGPWPGEDSSDRLAD